MQKTQAWEHLHNPDYSGHLSMTEFYNLMIKAGYSHSAAQKSANTRGCHRLESGLKM